MLWARGLRCGLSKAIIWLGMWLFDSTELSMHCVCRVIHVSIIIHVLKVCVSGLCTVCLCWFQGVCVENEHIEIMNLLGTQMREDWKKFWLS